MCDIYFDLKYQVHPKCSKSGMWHWHQYMWRGLYQNIKMVKSQSTWYVSNRQILCVSNIVFHRISFLSLQLLCSFHHFVQWFLPYDAMYRFFIYSQVQAIIIDKPYDMTFAPSSDPISDAELDDQAKTFTFINLMPSTKYELRVRAATNEGVGDPAILQQFTDPILVTGGWVVKGYWVCYRIFNCQKIVFISWWFVLIIII